MDQGISKPLIEEIKAKTRISDIIGEFVKLKKTGSNLVGLCPFHNEKTPSFTIPPAENYFNCFGCDKQGDVYDFLQEYENMSLPEAVHYIAKKSNISMPEQNSLKHPKDTNTQKQESLFIITDVANNYFQEQLAKSEDVKKYLHNRGINDDSIAKFQIGFKRNTNLTKYLVDKGYKLEFLQDLSLTDDKGKDKIWNKITFPLHNINNKIIGFVHRQIKQSSNSSEKNRYQCPNAKTCSKKDVLYGLNHAKETIKKLKECIIVEGYIDVISLHQCGLINSVAICGTELFEEYEVTIKKYCSKITLLLDGDRSGIEATNKIIPQLLKNDFEVNVVILENQEDPSDCILRLGEEAFRDFFQNKKQSFYQYKSQEINATNDIPKRTTLVNNLIDTVSIISDDIKRNTYVNQIEKDFNIPKKDILQRMRQSKSKSLETIIDLYKEELKQTLTLIEAQQKTSIKNR